MSVAALIRENRDRLSPAERRVADVVLSDPHAVAFGTVAALADTAHTSGASVVRLATRLGLNGFAELQELVRGELTHDMRRATERIRRPASNDPIDRAQDLALASVSATLGAVDHGDYETAVKLLGNARTIFVLVAEESRGVGTQFCAEMSLIRPRVTRLQGSPVAVIGRLAQLTADDVVVALDVARYDRWVLEAAQSVSEVGATLIALTDSPLSPLADLANITFVISTSGPGPFDSHLPALTVFETLVAGVAAHLQSAAVNRLDGIEQAWDAAAVFLEDN